MTLGILALVKKSRNANTEAESQKLVDVEAEI